MTHQGPPQGQPGPQQWQPSPVSPPQQPNYAPQAGQPYPPQQWQGQPPAHPQAPAPSAPYAEHNWVGITGLVVGIVAVVIVAVIGRFGGAGFGLGVLAVLFSGVGLTKAKIGTASNRGMSRAGMALGLLALAAVVVLSLPR